MFKNNVFGLIIKFFVAVTFFAGLTLSAQASDQTKHNERITDAIIADVGSRIANRAVLDWELQQQQLQRQQQIQRTMPVQRIVRPINSQDKPGTKYWSTTETMEDSKPGTVILSTRHR